MKNTIQYIVLIIAFFSQLPTHASSSQNNEKRNHSYADTYLKILPAVSLTEEYRNITDTLIFLHPPKVGGTSVDYAIRAAGNIKTTRVPTRPISPGFSPTMITWGWLGGLKNLDKNRLIKDHYQVIRGHFPYGLHEYLPQKCSYIALIRHPLERELSSANFDYQRGYIQKDEIEHYLLNVMIDNPQTRLLAGADYMDGICDEKTLNQAKTNLEKYFLIAGITEDTDTFIQVLASMLHFAPFAMSKQQVTGDKALAQLSDSLRQQLTQKHSYDIALYEYVKSRWIDWKKTNILATCTIDPKTKILTIMPDYLESRETLYMTTEEIQQYNQTHEQKKIHIKQK